jgi:hypothetical protein
LRSSSTYVRQVDGFRQCGDIDPCVTFTFILEREWGREREKRERKRERERYREIERDREIAR